MIKHLGLISSHKLQASKTATATAKAKEYLHILPFKVHLGYILKKLPSLHFRHL